MTTIVVLVMFLIGSSLGFDIPELLTEQERIRIFGTNSSDNLPIIETIHIELLNIQDLKPFRKRPSTVLQYRTTINDEVLILTLKPNRQFIAPGCLVHHYQRNNNKLLYPCFKEVKHCFYTGRSIHHNDSWVAASVCGGLMGAIVYGNTSIIVAPLNKTKYSDPNSVHETEHVIYRYQGDKQKCSTSYPRGHVVYPSQVGQGRMVNVNVSQDSSDDGRRRYMEVSVVLDPTMTSFHGEDTDHYTAIAFNLASHLYSNRRAGTNIELVLTGILKLDSYESLNIEHTRDARKLLAAFCSWKSRDTSDILDADATVFLTTTDIAANDQDQTTGLAYPSSMCDKGRNCALVQDTGPNMGYTIAHEIGHLLSMKHDGPDGDTSCTGPSIMNVYGASGEAASTWSSCSQNASINFIREKGSCLLNKPKGYCSQPSGYYAGCSNISLPGVIYPLEKQCQLLVGPNASPCVLSPETMKNLSLDNMCQQIICKESQYAMCYLSTPPLLDGTDINNTRTWCIDGKPVRMTDEFYTKPIDGKWSVWSSEWSPCTRSCGGGVRIRRRYCNNPKPQFSGNNCPGSDVQAVMCNMQKCKTCYKEEQCSRLNNNTYDKYGNITFTFVPYLLSKGDASCKQQCKGSSPLLGDGRSVLLNNTYANFEDGTECVLDKYVPFTRCIDGKCRSFGCDGHLDSGLEFDKCGVCNGTGKTCQTARGKFTKDGNSSEFETFLVLPRGSAGITVNQTNQYCYLSAVVEGERAFNSDGTDVAGVFFSNSVRIHYNNYPEQIKITGPLPTEVEIQVNRKYDYRKFIGVTPNISYEYNTVITQHPMYSWSSVQKPCSKPCGSGVRVSDVRCWDPRGPVEDYHCRIEDKPNEGPIACNTHACPPEWRIGKWSSCSVTCGRGFRNRTVECVQERNNVFVVMNDSYCHQASRPKTIQTCNMRRCPSVWRTGNWSQCSMTCGVGQQNRNVHCYDKKDPSLRVDDRFCSIDEKPHQIQFCDQGFCWTANAGRCTDADRCSGYDKGLCVGSYIGWARNNCLKLCGICSIQVSDNCSDAIPNCSAYNLTSVCKQYKVWANAKCRRSCGICGKCEDDYPHCAGYERQMCTSEFAPWFKKNCYRFCGYCCADIDTACDRYGMSACTNYRPYMEKHCQRYCKIC